MSDILQKAVESLTEKLTGADLGSTVRFDIEEEGSVMVDGDNIAPGDGEADVVISAALDTFQGLMDGDLDPTSAYMGGKLKIDGDMGLAMKLAQLLS